MISIDEDPANDGWIHSMRKVNKNGESNSEIAKGETPIIDAVKKADVGGLKSFSKQDLKRTPNIDSFLGDLSTIKVCVFNDEKSCMTEPRDCRNCGVVFQRKRLPKNEPSN